MKLLSISKACEYLGLGRGSVMLMVFEKRLEVIKVGKQYKTTIEWINRSLEQDLKKFKEPMPLYFSTKTPYKISSQKKLEIKRIVDDFKNKNKVGVN